MVFVDRSNNDLMISDNWISFLRHWSMQKLSRNQSFHQRTEMQGNTVRLSISKKNRRHWWMFYNDVTRTRRKRSMPWGRTYKRDLPQDSNGRWTQSLNICFHSLYRKFSNWQGVTFLLHWLLDEFTKYKPCNTRLCERWKAQCNR